MFFFESILENLSNLKSFIEINFQKNYFIKQKHLITINLIKCYLLKILNLII